MANDHRPNPYAAPSADLGKPAAAPPEKGSAFKAVILAFLADVLATLLLSFIFGAALTAFYASSGQSMEDIAAMLMEPADDSAYSIGLLAIGSLCSVLGGYLCSRIARHSEYRLGAILAALSVLAGLLLGAGYVSARMHLITFVLTIGSVMIGSWIGLQHNLRTQRSPD